MTTPQIFDEALFARRQSRARDPLPHALAAEELSDRLAEVNRSFPRAVLVGNLPGPWLAALEGHSRLGRLEAIAPAPVLDLPGGGDPEAPDLVILAFWLHGCNDPVGALIQARRALKPDGLMIAALPGGRTLHELRAALAEAEAEVTGGLSPRVAPMAEIRDLGALLQRAGFSMPVADATKTVLSHPDAFALMRDLRAMGETNALAARARHPTRRAVLVRAAGIYAAAHAGPDGRIPATLETVWLTGWAPGPDQPEPRRPGSATARLADALGTVERPAGEKAGR